MTDVSERLAELRDAGLHRRMRQVSGPQGPRIVLDGREVLLLCSNNYLGLADHPVVRRAAAAAAARWGAGAGASRLISGNMTLHRRLEQRLAEFEQTEAALLFGSGYLANLGTVSALARRDEVVFSDELNHASIVDGCRLSRAETFVYRHCDVEHLAWGLERAGGRGSLIVTDGVFSMDGDVAPLAELVGLAKRYDCRLMVDEAHATGTIGPEGRGSVADAGLSDQVDVIVGTLGKALGSYGAYVCASAEIVELLVNASRPFIFSTGLPPSAAAAAIASLALISARPQRIERLRSNATTLRRALAAEGMPVEKTGTQIVPIVVGDPQDATRLSEEALRHGVFAQAIRPPTVPAGSSRLRLTVMASHRPADLERAAGVIGAAARRLGLADSGAPVGGAAEVAIPDRDRAHREDEPLYAPAQPGGAGSPGAPKFADWGAAETLAWDERRGRAADDEALEVPGFVADSAQAQPAGRRGGRDHDPDGERDRDLRADRRADGDSETSEFDAEPRRAA